MSEFDLLPITKYILKLDKVIHDMDNFSYIDKNGWEFLVNLKKIRMIIISPKIIGLKFQTSQANFEVFFSLETIRKR